MKTFFAYFTRSKIFIIFFAILAFFFVFFAENAFAQSSDFTSSGFTINLSSIDPIRNDANVSPNGAKGIDGFKTIMKYVSNFLLTMIPLLAGVSIIIAGYYFIFSGGEGDRVSKGKNIIKFNIIAIIVAFMSWSIIYMISTFFGS